jgi:hypothetical protein
MRLVHQRRATIDDIHHWNRQVFAETPPTYLYNGKPNSLAAALQQQEKLLKLHLHLI